MGPPTPPKQKRRPADVASSARPVARSATARHRCRHGRQLGLHRDRRRGGWVVRRVGPRPGPQAHVARGCRRAEQPAGPRHRGAARPRRPPAGRALRRRAPRAGRLSRRRRSATGVSSPPPSTSTGVTATLADGTVERARRVILATGMDYRLPDVPGLAERWGRSVFHCPFCHGWEVRDRPLGVLDGDPATGVHRALLLRAGATTSPCSPNGPADARRPTTAAPSRMPASRSTSVR